MNEKLVKKLRSLIMKEMAQNDTNEISENRQVKNILRQRIIRLRREADQLSALLEEIPDNLSVEASSALWRLIINR